MRSQSSSVISCTLAAGTKASCPPTTVMRMSSPASSVAAVLTKASMSSGDLPSPVRPRDFAPADATSAAASSARSRSTSATATALPAAASPRVIARPIPAPPPPMTKALFPASAFGSSTMRRDHAESVMVRGWPRGPRRSSRTRRPARRSGSRRTSGSARSAWGRPEHPHSRSALRLAGVKLLRNWSLYLLDGEPEPSEHTHGAALPALEVPRGKSLARGELIGRAQDRLRWVTVVLPDQLVRRGRRESVLGKELLRPKAVVLLQCVRHVVMAHLVPCDRMCHLVLQSRSGRSQAG